MGGWCVVERSQIVVKIKMMRGVEDGRGEGARGGKFVRGASGGCGVSMVALGSISLEQTVGTSRRLRSYLT